MALRKIIATDFLYPLAFPFRTNIKFLSFQLMKLPIFFALSCIFVACSVSWNPLSPINSTVYGRNGNVRIYINNMVWYPDSVVTVNKRDTSATANITNHVFVDAWSDGYRVQFSFVLPDTLDHGYEHPFVVNREATLNFFTPWPKQNEWQNTSDSCGVLTATRVNDSTVSGRINAKFQSALATYWLEGGGFTTRIRVR